MSRAPFRLAPLDVTLDQAFKGQGLGGALLADTLDRAAQSEIAAHALMVDAKDETAAAFYRHHGFIALPDTPLMLFLFRWQRRLHLEKRVKKHVSYHWAMPPVHLSWSLFMCGGVLYHFDGKQIWTFSQNRMGSPISRLRSMARIKS